MTPEKQQALDEHIREIAKILHEDTPPEELNNLAAIEQAVRNQVQKHVAPKIGFFLLKQRQEQPQDIPEP
jgi:hypothetical protein